MTRHVDGRLSARAQATWPKALVVKDVDDRGVESWWLERPGQERTGLGRHYGEAVPALTAVIRAEGRG